jgi:splicing factor U2AF 65 kDa subunit
MQEQQLRARQLVLQQQAASAVAAAAKTQREIYVGNLVPGVVTDFMLRQLFNATLQAAFPDHCAGGSVEPVLRINMNTEGKYCFMELLSAEMATACLALTGQIQLAGQALSIGRPAGYVDPAKAQAAAQAAAEGLARFQAESQAARREAGIPPEADDPTDSPFLRIDGMVTAQVLADDAEYAEVFAEVRGEFEQRGTLLRLVIPRPEDLSQAEHVLGTGPYGGVFVQYLDADGARAAKAAVDGRLFAGQKIRVMHMQAAEYMEAVGQTN